LSSMPAAQLLLVHPLILPLPSRHGVLVTIVFQGVRRVLDLPYPPFRDFLNLPAPIPRQRAGLSFPLDDPPLS